MTRTRFCEECGEETPHRQQRPADVPGDTYECLLCPVRVEVEAVAGGSDR